MAPAPRVPAGPSSRGDTRAPTSPPQATVPPVDLAAVRRTDAIIESLAARGGAGSAGRSLPGAETGRPLQAEDADPAVRLLCALIDDVDDPGTGDTGPAPPSGPGPGPRRRGPRTIVALGVAGAVLASGGVAAAGGDADRSSRAAAPAPRSTAGGAEEAAKAARADTDAGTYVPPRARGGARRAPEPGRSAPKPQPPRPEKAKDREAGDRDEPRRGHPFPLGPRQSRPELPTITVRSDDPRFTADRTTRSSTSVATWKTCANAPNAIPATPTAAPTSPKRPRAPANPYSIRAPARGGQFSSRPSSLSMTPST